MTDKLDQKGMSLIELLIVLAIITIMAIVAVPSFTPLTSHQRLNSAAATLLGDIRSTRERAIKEGWQYGIYYASTTKYQVIKAAQPTFIATGGPLSGGTVVATRDFTSSATGYTYPGITITVPASMPVFQASGAVSSWTSGTSYSSVAPSSVTLTRSSGEGRKICLYAMGYSHIINPANSC